MIWTLEVVDVAIVAFGVTRGCKFVQQMTDHRRPSGATWPTHVDILLSSETLDTEGQGFVSGSLTKDLIRQRNFVSGLKLQATFVALPTQFVVRNLSLFSGRGIFVGCFFCCHVLAFAVELRVAYKIT